jgi:hypothetical protein
VKSTCECPYAQEAGEVGGDVAFPAPGERDARDVLEARVDGRAGGREAVDLGGVLDGAEHGQRVGHRDVARRGERGLEAEEVHRPGGVGDRVAPARIEQRRGRRVGVLAVRPVVQRDTRRGRRRLRARALEDGHDHRGRLRGLDGEQRDALGDRDRRVAREVDEVRAGRDEDAGKPGGGRLRRGPLEASGEVVGGGAHRGILPRRRHPIGVNRARVARGTVGPWRFSAG